jgi:hypothetical protein
VPQTYIDLWLLFILMKQIIKISLVFLYFIIKIDHCRATPPGEYSTLHCKNFIIIHTSADSANAVKAGEILTKSYDEITWDFQITQKDTFQVFIIGTRKEFQHIVLDKLPAWVEAFATPALKRMIIKSPRWASQDQSFSVDLIHELLHLLVYQDTKGKSIPRWLDEGLAIFYSNEQHWKSATALSKAIITHSLIPLDSIDHVLSFQRVKADLAYQESYSATQYILQYYDIEAIRTILNGIRDNQDINGIFLNATGSTFADLEQEWRRYIIKRYKWYWLSDLDDFIWIFLVILFIIAILFIRHRNKKIMQNWQQETEQEIEQETLDE